MGGMVDWITGSSIGRGDGQEWDERSRALYEAGYRLIGAQDFEAVSVSQIAEAAGCSVGAFYQRFENKDRFVGFLVRAHFEIMSDRVRQALDAGQWADRSGLEIVDALVVTMLDAVQGHGAGIARAAIKRCHSDDISRQPVERYRALVVDQAVALLVPVMGEGSGASQAQAVREAVQMAQAVVFDSLIYGRGALRLDWPDLMRDALVAMLVAALLAEGVADPADEQAAEGGGGEPEPVEVPGPERRDLADEDGAASEVSEAPVRQRSRRVAKAQRRRNRFFVSVSDVRDWLND